jgi:hypothetical protein
MAGGCRSEYAIAWICGVLLKEAGAEAGGNPAPAYCYYFFFAAFFFAAFFLAFFFAAILSLL